MNGEMSADLISEAEHKGQSEKQGVNNDTRVTLMKAW